MGQRRMQGGSPGSPSPGPGGGHGGPPSHARGAPHPPCVRLCRRPGGRLGVESAELCQHGGILRVVTALRQEEVHCLARGPFLHERPDGSQGRVVERACWAVGLLRKPCRPAGPPRFRLGWAGRRKQGPGLRGREGEVLVAAARDVGGPVTAVRLACPRGGEQAPAGEEEESLERLPARSRGQIVYERGQCPYPCGAGPPWDMAQEGLPVREDGQHGRASRGLWA